MVGMPCDFGLGWRPGFLVSFVGSGVTCSFIWSVDDRYSYVACIYTSGLRVVRLTRRVGLLLVHVCRLLHRIIHGVHPLDPVIGDHQVRGASRSSGGGHYGPCFVLMQRIPQISKSMYNIQKQIPLVITRVVLFLRWISRHGRQSRINTPF